jgi:phosphoribosyl-ATP pyrophosphohydrolase
MKTFDDLWSELNDKAKNRPTGSKTVSELDSGVHNIGKKVLEEAGEVWLAAEYQSDDDLALEISQLIYHLQVIAIARGLSIDAIYSKL